MNKRFALALQLGQRRRGQGTPPGQRQCGERVETRAKNQPDTLKGCTQVYLPGRSPPVATRALQDTEGKGEVREAVHRKRPAGGRQPRRSAVGLLHACQQSNTCQGTSPQPGQPARAPACPASVLTIARWADRKAAEFASLPFMQPPAPRLSLSRPIVSKLGGTSRSGCGCARGWAEPWAGLPPSGM